MKGISIKTTAPMNLANMSIGCIIVHLVWKDRRNKGMSKNLNHYLASYTGLWLEF